MSIKALIFDFGNVIAHFEKRRTTERLKPHSLFSFDELHHRLFDPALEDPYEHGRLSDQQMLVELKDRGRLSCSLDQIAIAWSDIFWPNDEVTGLVGQLAGHYRLILGSNTNRLHAKQFTRQLASTLAHFSSLVLSHEIAMRKPMVGFYDECVKRAGCRAAECLFIDDLSANVAGAQARGLAAVIFRDFQGLVRDLERHGVQAGRTNNQL